MNAFERRVRAAVYASFRDEAAAPSVSRLAADLAASREDSWGCSSPGTSLPSASLSSDSRLFTGWPGHRSR